ncbi:MAG: sensor histidine kinase [Bacillota bacterium]
MKLKLKTRLSLYYVLLALFMVSLLSVLTNVFLERQFRDYITKQQRARNQEIVNLISQQFDIYENRWNSTTIEDIGINALEQGLIVKVADKAGNTIWDATVHNEGLCAQMIEHMSQNMISRYPNFEGDYVVDEYPLERDSILIGTVKIGYYGPFYFTDNDLAFINTLNKILAIVGLFSLMLALLVGTITARRFSYPISQAVNTAREIGRGRYNSRILNVSNTIEIDELTTTINELAEGLGKQEKLRRRLTTDVAHELRTPLATLQSHIEAMIDGIWEPDTDRLKSCHEETMRISRMVGDLEKLAHYESENLKLNKERFDLAELVRQIVTNFEADFVNKNILVELQGNVTPLTADRDKISQVIVNLLSNALKYTPAGGKIDILVNRDKNQVVLKVKNTGIGIAPEDLPHIFERFYRADQSRNRETGGAGVGLAIVKAIVNAHGGMVSAHSVMNEGTTFTVILPG